MTNDIAISPEIILIDKLEELDSTLAPSVWEDLRQEVADNQFLEDNDRTTLPAVRHRKKIFIQDFVNKAISLPLEVYPEVDVETMRQLYRLQIFACQRVVNLPSVKFNPFSLGVESLTEMKTALVALLVTQGLINPSSSRHSWTREFFEKCVYLDKGPDGHTIINIRRIPSTYLEEAITDSLITDWFIYRAYDNRGIRTLMDMKNHLIDLPNYMRGGNPVVEFSRFQRKFREQENKKRVARDEALDLEYRKTIVKEVAYAQANNLISSGLSANEILEQAFNSDLQNLSNSIKKPQRITNSQQKRLELESSNQNKMDRLISKLLNNSED